MILNRLKERLGFTLVVVAAGVGAAWFKGASPVAAAVGVSVGLALVTFWRNSPGPKNSSDVRISDRRPGEPFRWGFHAAGDRSRSDAVDSLRSFGLRLDLDEGHNVRLESGSQLRTRLLGGYFVDPKHLPLTVHVEESTDPDALLSIQVEDRLGAVAVRDQALKARYELRVEQIRDALR